MNKTIRLGTRKSALAVIQTELVADALKKVRPEAEVELVLKQTEGDRILNKPLLEFGGKGVFVTEFEQAILAGEIDFAVHSAKDLPMDLEDGLAIVAVLPREDPRDVLVTPAGTVLEGKKELVIGTSSLRRRVQIEELAKTMWPGSRVRCEDIRGNVQTRLKKLEEGPFDALILAAAGLKRLNLLEDKRYEYHFFSCEEFIPAGGQGILAVEGRWEDGRSSLCMGIQDEAARICLNLERRILRLLEAGCHEPIGIYSRLTNGQLEVFGINRRNGETKKIHIYGGADELELLAERAAKGLR